MTRLTAALQLLLAAIREIFDEAAYDRFLQRKQIPSSPAAYAQFWRERESASRPRPRCC